MFTPSSPVTGGAQVGLTSPTYTLVADIAPGVNGKQYAVSALGGTQTGVNIHSVAAPFTLSAFRPMVLKGLPPANPVTGALPSVPRNVYKIITRKGVVPLSGQAAVPMLVETIIHVPAGSDTADPQNIVAALSLHIGAIWAQSSALGDVSLSGLL